MGSILEGKTIAVLGGDARYQEMINSFLRSGMLVQVLGFSLEKTVDVVTVGNVEECLYMAEAVVLPVMGTDEAGFFQCVTSKETYRLTVDVLRTLPEGAFVFTGLAGTALEKMTADASLRLVQLMNLDEVAILNAIPSAEGSIQMAMEMLPITIHGSKAYVIGFGRTGQTLARLLRAMGAHTGVVARKPADLARITEMALQPVPLANMEDYLGEADVIFNTVPAQILHGGVLASCKKGTLIIDLASAPGGTDFLQAQRLGLNAVLAPGLPGIVAPITSGMILAKAIKRILAEDS
jgi:dipicolinate synthase subunit A